MLCSFSNKLDFVHLEVCVCGSGGARSKWHFQSRKHKESVTLGIKEKSILSEEMCSEQ